MPLRCCPPGSGLMPCRANRPAGQAGLTSGRGRPACWLVRSQARGLSKLRRQRVVSTTIVDTVMVTSSTTEPDLTDNQATVSTAAK